jgi:hypothetical protein
MKEKRLSSREKEDCDGTLIRFTTAHANLALLYWRINKCGGEFVASRTRKTKVVLMGSKHRIRNERDYCGRKDPCLG